MTRQRQVAACALLALGCSLLAIDPHHANPVDEHEHRATDRPARPEAAAAAATTTRLHLKLGPTGHPEIPGLYDERDRFIRPIQGKADFQRRVLGLPVTSPPPPPSKDENDTANQASCPASDENMLRAGANQTMSLVQFYMATCPDCQGFSPYFKRLARDIGPHWHRLVRVYVVNCNDHQNIHLCQEENPRLIVPMVRWYVLPVIQADAFVQRAASRPLWPQTAHSLALTESPTTNNGTCRAIKYPQALLNVAHRQFVDKQRRDLISLRHATLRFTLHMLDVLSGHNSTVDKPPEASRDMFHALAIHWRHLPQLGHAAHHHFRDLAPANEFARELQWRVQECLRAANGEIVHKIGNRAGGHQHHHGKRATDREHYDHTSGFEHSHDVTSGGQHHHEHQFDATHYERLRVNMTDREHHKQHNTTGGGGGGGGHLKHHSENSTPIDKVENVTLRHFVVFEARNSFVGPTVIADWSSYVCNPNATLKVASKSVANSDSKNAYRKTLMMVHRTSDMSVLASIFNQSKPASDDERVLVAFDLAPISARNLTGAEEIQSLRQRVTNLRVIRTGSGDEIKRARRMAAAAAQPVRRVQQRASLERYYRGGHHLRRRDTNAAAPANISAPSEAAKIKAQAEREHANWTPELVFPHEEAARYRANKFIAQEMRFELLTELVDDDNSSRTEPVTLLPGALLAGQHPGEIGAARTNVESAVDPKTDDLTLMFLTDYYKGLDEILHTDLVSKGDLDGYQLLASCCFLRDLKRHFPFQGDAHGSEQVAGKSRARHYVQLIQRAWLGELKKHLLLGWDVNGTTSPYGEAKIARVFDKMRGRRDECPKVHELSWQLVELRKELARDTDNENRAGASGASEATEIAAQMEHVRVPFGRLESDQTEIRRAHDVGLPPEKKFKWYYCAGSGAYLRGHTCSLWILFHTLTVSEYLDRVESDAWLKASNETIKTPVEYKFQIDFAQKPGRPCDPKNPDDAYLASKSSDLYVNETHHVLANIVNFVRFYLPCTNCAAHFSCMVNHSPGLSFDAGRSRAAPDAHLLWLWEGHNRVNERTRATHSEDPHRPKHVFPVYEACPACYVERPAAANASLVERKFNRRELVKFLVARYRKSAILNNKINIELLYKDTR